MFPLTKSKIEDTPDNYKIEVYCLWDTRSAKLALIGVDSGEKRGFALWTPTINLKYRASTEVAGGWQVLTYILSMDPRFRSHRFYRFYIAEKEVYWKLIAGNGSQSVKENHSKEN